MLIDYLSNLLFNQTEKPNCKYTNEHFHTKTPICQTHNRNTFKRNKIPSRQNKSSHILSDLLVFRVFFQLISICIEFVFICKCLHLEYKTIRFGIASRERCPVFVGVGIDCANDCGPFAYN